METQKQLLNVSENAAHLREAVRVNESKIHWLEFEMQREKGLHDETGANTCTPFPACLARQLLCFM